MDNNYYMNITQEEFNDIPKEEIGYIQRVQLGNETRLNVKRTTERSKAGEDLANRIITTMSTLVVAIASFYFGSKSVSEAKALLTSVPLIRSNRSHRRGEKKDGFEFKIFGGT